MLDNNGVHPITYTAKTAQKAYKDAEQAFKFELEEPQKVVDYFGLKLVVPDETGYLFAFKDGAIIWSHFNPELSHCYSTWIPKVEHSFAIIGDIKSMPHPDWWKESLIEV